MTTVEIDGISWAYSERGHGPTVLFLHGTLASQSTFAGIVDDLSDRYRCIALDWPGHGASGYHPGGWTSDDLVAGLIAMIETTAEGPVALVGQSQGGAVALRVALRRPDLLWALVTMSAGPDGPSQDACDALARLGTTLAFGSTHERSAAVRMMQTGFHTPGWASANPIAAQRELEVMLSHDRAAMQSVTAIASTYESVQPQLSRITGPTLVMWGADDVRADWGPAMVRALPNARLVTVPDAGHHLTHDAPDRCARTIGSFLDHERPPDD